MKSFQKTVWDFYYEHKREMPWRRTLDPYAILVSEVMLQQTQVDRVIPIYEKFLKRFPTLRDLADASFKDVLEYWQGLGYNRRALWLHQAAQTLAKAHVFPTSPEELVKLKGIGPNTAAAICVYAFHQPLVFIETNIRAVYIHHFFPDFDKVDDKALIPLIEKTLDKKNPREWYWALMDYGSSLKKFHKNPARRSKHHSVQSKFEGSRRQVRGKILRSLLKGEFHVDNIAEFSLDIESILADMEKDGLIVRDADMIKLVER